MPQSLSQIQQQRQEQRLHTSIQQMQLAKLLELSVDEYCDRVKREMVENPVLEEGRFGGDDENGDTSSISSDEMEQNDSGEDKYCESDEDLHSNIEEELKDYDSDDLPVHASGSSQEDRNELPIGDSGSFIEYLESQIMNYDLDEVQEQILRYLIGSLDNRGFIDTSLYTVVEELAFKQYIYVEEKDVEEVLKVLQSFDPPGIGARDVRECLLLQIEREMESDEPISELKERFLTLMHTMVADHYELFIKRDIEALQQELGLKKSAVEALFEEIKKKYNVNPGMSLGESSKARVQTLIPDFIVETDTEGNISMRLNNGNVPRVHVSRDYIEQLKFFQANPSKMGQRDKEAMLYTRDKVEAAQMFIENMRQRRRTLYEVMNAIIDKQRQFFLSRDESDKVRLVLKDIAEKAKCDISTVSRVCNSKSVMVDGRIYALSEFFKMTRTNSEGEEVDGSEVTKKLKALIDSEDKSNPYSDDQLADMLSEQGINLARRSVAKYRAKMQIPSSTQRKTKRKKTQQ